MREILFRGKLVDNGDWVEGSLIVNHYDRAGKPEDEYRIVDTYYGLDDEDLPTYQSGLDEAVVPSTVGQYTGLTDKNGKKIFEGDILREPPRDNWEKRNYVGFEVFYHDNDACDHHVGWQMNRLHFYGALCGADIYPRSFRPIWTNRMEVIGNIYDNPELIGGEKK